MLCLTSSNKLVMLAIAGAGELRFHMRDCPTPSLGHSLAVATEREDSSHVLLFWKGMGDGKA